MFERLNLSFTCNRSLHFNQLSGPVPSTLNNIVAGTILSDGTGPTVGLLQMYVHFAIDSCQFIDWAIAKNLYRTVLKRINICIQCLLLHMQFFYSDDFLPTDLLFVFHAALVISRLTNNSLTGTLPNLNALNQLQYV